MRTSQKSVYRRRPGSDHLHLEGANVKYLFHFDKVFPGTETIMMTKNYRSTPQILAAVNSLIDKNEHRIKKT